MTQLSIDFNPPTLAQRVATARKLGDEAGALCLDRAESIVADFGARAFEFIREYAQQHSTFTGEDATNAAKMAGIRPLDDRAFGPVYAKAIRQSVIRVIGFVPRVKGHGSAGGKLYTRVVQ